MLSLERKRTVLQYLRTHGSGNVSDMADVLGVSQSTVRRDLTDLEQLGLLRRVHGGASLADNELEALPDRRQLLMRDEKARIGAAAAQLVRDSQTILITGGSTTEMMLPHLADRTNLTVVTNGLAIAHSLAAMPQINVVVLGGVLRHTELSLLGPLTAANLTAFHVDQAFVGTYGLDSSRGLTGAYPEEASTDSQMLSAIETIIVLADSGKFDIRGPARLLGVEAIHAVITDTAVRPQDIAALHRHGVEVTRV